MAASADSLPPSTWVQLASLPNPSRAPVFAIAVDPVNDHAVIAGGGQGGLYRSSDGGAPGTRGRRATAPGLSTRSSPSNPPLVLPGPRAAGGLMSTDGGGKGSPAPGLAGPPGGRFG